jgi:hypothetical protein
MARWSVHSGEGAGADRIRRVVFCSAPVLYSLSLIVCMIGWVALPGSGAASRLWGFSRPSWRHLPQEFSGTQWSDWYEELLANSLPFSLLTGRRRCTGWIVQILPR